MKRFIAGLLAVAFSFSVAAQTCVPVRNGGTAVCSPSATTVYPSSGTVVVQGGALGTPASGTLTNATGLPIGTGVSGLGTGIATFLTTPSSANLASALTDESGSGLAMFVDAAASAWTVTDTSGGGLSLTLASNVYRNFGPFSFGSAIVTFPVTADGNNVSLSMPVTVLAGSRAMVTVTFNNSTQTFYAGAAGGTANIVLSTNAGVSITNNLMSAKIITLTYLTLK